MGHGQSEDTPLSSVYKLFCTCALEKFWTVKSIPKFVMSADSTRSIKIKHLGNTRIGWQVTSQCGTKTHRSSNAMETQGAGEMWARSVAKNKMRYTTFVGDGDSKAYKSVCDAKPYGDIEIKKTDCIGYVQKRMGNRLREKRKASEKLEDGKSKGKGQTNRCCD